MKAISLIVAFMVITVFSGCSTNQLLHKNNGNAHSNKDKSKH